MPFLDTETYLQIADGAACEMVKADLSLLEFRVLHKINIEPGPIDAICRHLEMPPEVLLGVVQSLENKGLVRRQDDPNNEWVFSVRVTSEGWRLLQTIAASARRAGECRFQTTANLPLSA